MKKYVKYIGNIVAILSIIFIINALFKFDISLSTLMNPKIVVSILGLSIISILGIVLDALAGRYLIKDLLGEKIALKSLYQIYSKSNIAKYIPGNVMHYVSRSIYCREYNITSSDMTYITILEITLKVITAFGMALILAYEQINIVMEIMKIDIRINRQVIVIVIILILIGLLIILYYKQSNIYTCVGLIFKLIKSILAYMFIFIINASIFIIIAGLNYDKMLDSKQFMYVIGVYTMAWLIGYITPGAPGGIGIKETITVILLSPIYGEKIVLLVAVITRIISVIGDVLGYLIGRVSSYKSTKEYIGDIR